MQILSGVDHILGMYGKFANFVVCRSKTGKMFLRKRPNRRPISNINNVPNHHYFYSQAVARYNRNIKPYTDRIQHWNDKAQKLDYYTRFTCYMSAFLDSAYKNGLEYTITLADQNKLDITKKTDRKKRSDNKNDYLNQKLVTYQNKKDTIRQYYEALQWFNENKYTNVWDIIFYEPDKNIKYLKKMNLIEKK